MATPTSTEPESITHAIGVLCVGGDWACAHGDLEALGYVARQLVDCTHEPLHCELLALADACRDNPDHAMAAWVMLKEIVQQGFARQ